MMSVADMKALLHSRGKDVEAYLVTCLDGRDVPQRLKDSMLPPACHLPGAEGCARLCLSTAALCGLSPQRSMPFAAAIEMIHTYSLIHDDLPAMDNDDLRRGKPSNHKAFDEATAILAGDGLLTDAFMVMCRTAEAPDRVLDAVSELSLAAGSSGMVGGQEWDMLYTGASSITPEQMRAVHSMKTGALLRASCVCGAILAGAETPARNHSRLRRSGSRVPTRLPDDINRCMVSAHGNPGRNPRAAVEQGRAPSPC